MEARKVEEDLVQQEIKMEVLKILLLVLLAGLIVWPFIKDYIREKERNELAKKNMSFMESLNLTGLPIVTFTNNGKMLNMILDTGSNACIINSEILEGLEYDIISRHTGVIGLSGDVNGEGIIVEIPVTYKDRTFEVQCYTNNMAEAVNSIKQQYGVTIHGILGTGFFTDYKYILDFNELVAYSLKKTK